MPSTGTVGASYDNALAENVNGSYKNESIHNRTRHDAPKTENATFKRANWWNTPRPHHPLNYRTPNKAENDHCHIASTSKKTKTKANTQKTHPGHFKQQPPPKLHSHQNQHQTPSLKPKTALLGHDPISLAKQIKTKPRTLQSEAIFHTVRSHMGTSPTRLPRHYTLKCEEPLNAPLQRPTLGRL